ncbi:MAG: RNA polymerase sporulation sigma factor SigE [Clostridiales bacterium]|nr:RNA polymerase sporulation sigma factor SigE [Clostridiales bacterium]
MKIWIIDLKFSIHNFLKKIKKWILDILSKIWGESIYYIGGSDILPAPLNKDDEAKYIAMLKTNPEEGRHVLIEHNLRLVVYIARKFENTGINLEDLISIGTIGLIKAVKTFDSEKNIKLATYASRCIENEILMFLRKNNNIRQEVSFDEPLKTDSDGSELLLSDILGTEKDIVSHNLDDEVECQLLNEALRTLPEREQVIMKLRFGLDKPDEDGELTQKEVADMLGISQSYISRLEKKIMQKLKQEIKKLS